MLSKNNNQFHLKPLVLFTVTATLVLISSCAKSDKDQPKTDKQQTEKKQTEQTSKIDTTLSLTEAKFVCPMHPLERSKESGRCPICKMNLVSIQELNKELSEEHEKLQKKFEGAKNAIHFEVNVSVMKSDVCQTYIESALSKDPGVLGYHVDILNRVVHLYFDKSKTTKGTIEQAIANAGFDANNIKANPEASGKLPQGCR